MYFKDNGKSLKISHFTRYDENDYVFIYYEFNKIQQWLEIGQRLRKIYVLYQIIDELLNILESEHGPIVQKTYNKESGFVGSTAKDIAVLVEPEQQKYICRMIAEVINKDLKLIVTIDRRLKKLRPFINIIKVTEIFGNPADVKKIEEHFSFLILDGLKKHLLEFWDLSRKFYDDETNEINIPEPTKENKEFFQYFLYARDCYCENNKEIALAIMRKAVEDILIKLWILNSDDPVRADISRRPQLDNLPGYLKNQGVLEEQEFREVMPLIKYGNTGIHVFGEIPLETLYSNCKLMINNGISFVNNLTKKYTDLMVQNRYSYIDIKKTEFSIGLGDL